MKTPKATQVKREREITVYIDRWAQRLFLQQWEFIVGYKETMMDGDAPNETCNADIYVMSEYHQAFINIYPHFWTQPKEQRERVVVHELCHILTNKLTKLVTDGQDGRLVPYDVTRKINEETTDHIANIAIFGCLN